MENPLAHNFPGGDIVCELHGAGDPGRIRPQTMPRLDRVDTRTSLGTAKGAWATTQGTGIGQVPMASLIKRRKPNDAWNVIDDEIVAV